MKSANAIYGYIKFYFIPILLRKGFIIIWFFAMLWNPVQIFLLFTNLLLVFEWSLSYFINEHGIGLVSPLVSN